MNETLDQLFRREAGRLVATIARRLGAGQLALAEDIAQDALVAAARAWTYEGPPENPAAWLHRAAYNRMIDRLRRTRPETGLDETMAGHSSDPTPGVEDDELRLILLCAHPDLAEPDRLALTLNTALGFTAREIAGLFLVPAATMSQRLTRVKARIRDSGLTLDWPLPADLAARLETVHKVIYLAFSLGYAPSMGEGAVRRDVALAALRLAETLAGAKMTASPDASALAALLNFQASRLGTRTDEAGRFVRLADQDRSRWDCNSIENGFLYLRHAQGANRLSRYHLEAGIAAAHAVSPDWASTDWEAICTSYDLLAEMTGSPIVALNQAIATAMRGDAGASLARLDALAAHPALATYGLYHAARGEILLTCGDAAGAATEFRAALAHGGTTPSVEHLESRLAACF
ncbi:RNA polymerase sigma factor [Gimibacter soli]|uniref:Sigma-70 family RNA polymerase sigma factor n=1 Tax=Gimibacter soli TaxID=3024400 RepID=A0AAF0BMA7_9PROT|nr:sigma-70 family RNA polymerase sigma factor [Gimibacter soli]WCL54300.1 sigma-70 family RNA polymerase sigma factor [Gimibacter soli]